MSTVFDFSKPIAIGADHAGYEYKTMIVEMLEAKGLAIKDVGTYSKDSVDYPDFAHPVSKAVENGEAACGILICGTANGVAITANKHQHVRAAICWTDTVATLVRQHNNANIICIPARFVSPPTAEEMVNIFLATAFEGGRHQDRLVKMACM
jgi:ribose 5-phosphate isomerase B